MSLRVYLDDCAYDKELERRLQQEGHDVITPVSAGLLGGADPVHMAYAATHGLILVTKNPFDFEVLHSLNSEHSGIIAIYQDNDAARDMSVAEIVRAINNLAKSGIPLEGQFVILNAWRMR